MEAYLKWRAENPDEEGGPPTAAKNADPGAELEEEDDYDDEDD